MNPVIIAFGAAAIGVAVTSGVALKYTMEFVPYIYSNTRASARYATLLKGKTYDELISAASFEEAIAILEDSSYSKIVEESNIVSIADALDMELYKEYEWIFRISPPKTKEIMSAIKDIFVIKDIKRALNSFSKGEMPRLRFIKGELKNSIESSPDMQTFIAAMESTRFKDELARANANDLSETYTRLDIAYYRRVSSVINKCDDDDVRAAFNEYWSVMIDFANIRMLIRALRMKKTPSLLTNGTIPIEALSSVTYAAQLDSLIADTQYANKIDTSSSLSIDIGLVNILKEKARNIASKYHLKTGGIIRLLIEKEIEVKNIYALLKLKKEGFSKEKIREVVFQ